MRRQIGYDDPAIAADVEAAYDAEVERDLRRLASAEKWERLGRRIGFVITLLVSALVLAFAYAAIVNIVHAVVWAIVWIWGWWG